MNNKHFISSIKAHEEISQGYFLLSLEIPSSVMLPKPGQFYMVKVGLDNDPLLRRPFSLHRLLSDDTFQLLYRIKGKGTRILSERKAGERLDIMGPLGRGFEVPSHIDNAILVAGGIGTAPLFPLAEELSNAGKPVRLFIGGKSKNDILCEKEFASLGLKLFISTDDSSYGEKGLVTELLENYLKKNSSQFTVQGSRIFSCGPKPMLKRVSELARLYSLSCYASIEERMGCGLGACLGCATKIKIQSSSLKNTNSRGRPSKSSASYQQLYKMVCKDGPVFNAEDIDWDG